MLDSPPFSRICNAEAVNVSICNAGKQQYAVVETSIYRVSKKNSMFCGEKFSFAPQICGENCIFAPQNCFGTWKPTFGNTLNGRISLGTPSNWQNLWPKSG